MKLNKKLLFLPIKHLTILFFICFYFFEQKFFGNELKKMTLEKLSETNSNVNTPKPEPQDITTVSSEFVIRNKGIVYYQTKNLNNNSNIAIEL